MGKFALIQHKRYAPAKQLKRADRRDIDIGRKNEGNGWLPAIGSSRFEFCRGSYRGLGGSCKGSVTGYMRTLDMALIKAADIISGYIQLVGP